MSVRRRGDRWVADTYDLTGRRLRKSYRTEKAAKKAERDAIDLREQGRLPADLRLTIGGFIDAEWEPTVKASVRPRTWESYAMHVDRYIRPLVGDEVLVRFRSRNAQAFLNELSSRGLSGATVERVYATLSTILKLGAEHGLCRAVAKRQLRFPAKHRRLQHVPFIDDVERLAEAIDARYWALILVCGYCGLRQGEVFALHPGDIDWLGYRIRVRRSVERLAGEPVRRVDRTKTGDTDSEVWIEMPQRVAYALSNHVREHPCSELVFHRDGWIIKARWFHGEIWDPARKACQLEDVRFHDLRHATPGILAAAGWSPKEVQEQMRHSSAAFTLDRYGHVFAQHAESRRRRLDDLLEQNREAAAVQSQEATGS